MSTYSVCVFKRVMPRSFLWLVPCFQVFCGAVLLYALVVDDGKKSEPYQEHAQDFCVYIGSFQWPHAVLSFVYTASLVYAQYDVFVGLIYVIVCPVIIFDGILIAFLANHYSALEHTMHTTWQALVLLMLNYSCYIVAILVWRLMCIFTIYPLPAPQKESSDTIQ